MILSIIILLIGLINPKWLFFWMETPSRIASIALSIAIFMIGAVLHGEGKLQLEQEKKQEARSKAIQPTTEVPDLH